MQKILKEHFSVFGRTTLRKFGKFKIYIEGLSKIGADLTTNLVMLTPHLITLYDPNFIRLEDCYATFHYPKQQINKKSRADHLIEMCHRLNNKVYVDKVNVELPEQSCLVYDILIFCDVYDLGRVISIDKFIRSQKQSKTVVMYTCQMGYFGLLITDFGQQWQMFHSGQQPPKVNIKGITNSQQGQVTTVIPHGYKTGDFIQINYAQGMKEVNLDSRPVTVKDDYKFLIEDTRSFGVYSKGGICQKINIVEKLKFQTFEEQLSKKHSEIMLTAKAIICYYQKNSTLPQLFNEVHQQQTYKDLKSLAEKSGQKYEQIKVRNVIKTCNYSFYPLISMFAGILSLQCVKCTGKYKPIKSPFFVDWYSKINFEVKKRLDSQFMNIIDTNSLQKLAMLQVGIVDDGSQSLQLLNLLYSSSIAEKTRIVLCGLQSINFSKEQDPLTMKAHLKYQVLNELFKSKKTQSIPCSLSFSNDLFLSDVWKKIKLLINTSMKLNEYVYNNVIWNQINIVDSHVHELSGVLKLSVANKSSLIQKQNRYENDTSKDYRFCVQKSIEEFRLLFIDVFEDVRCFFKIGGSYIDKVKMQPLRRNIFLFTICCLENDSHVDPENIVKMTKYIFVGLFPKVNLDMKDQMVADFMKSFYFLLSWFYTKKECKPEEIVNQFNMHLHKSHEQSSLSIKDKYDIAISKLAMMGNEVKIPYLSLMDLYRHQHTIKFIWNASQLHARSLVLDEQVNSKKFYRYYFRKLKPCPFITQILNSLIPLSVLQSLYGTLNNFEIDMIEGKINIVQCPLPIPFKPKGSVTTLVPSVCNQWTIIRIEGPKQISQIIQRFNVMQNITVSKIRCENVELYDKKSKKNHYLDQNVQNCSRIKEKKDEYELFIQAEDKDGRKCQVSRVKYVIV